MSERSNVENFKKALQNHNAIRMSHPRMFIPDKNFWNNKDESAKYNSKDSSKDKDKNDYSR